MAADNSTIREAVTKNLSKFETYNQIKRKSLYDSMGDQTLVNLFEMIPFLLHTNYRGLPGYIDARDFHCGVKDYTPPVNVIQFAHARFPDLQIAPVHHENPCVQMLALMGSGGTIAYTKESDFDFWVCYYESQVNPEHVDLFKRKCREIEHWIFDHFNKEVHFYLNEIVKVRANIFAQDEETFSGSSIGELLKEEFLRSSIVIQGGIPFWWVVPVGCDNAAYDQWKKTIDSTNLKDRFIDLGNLRDIKQEDFLPAALFQILKSLGSPFKSIIKLGLLERYLSGGADNPFISAIIKKNIHEGRYTSDDIDAYVIMFNQVYHHYYTLVKNEEVLEILKTSFYLKVEPKLYGKLKGGSGEVVTEKTKIMLNYMNQWGWSDKKIMQMDDFQNWGIDYVSKLLNNTKKFILNGYKQVLGSIEEHKVKHRFTPEELQAITRKIYSHFLVAENKIDNTLSFKSYPPEKLLKIEYVREKNGNEFWILSKRLIVKNVPTKIIIYKESSLFGLAIWLSLNGLFVKDFTRMEIDPGLHIVDPNAIRELITEASSHFSFKKVELYNSYFLKDPFPIMSFIVINPYSKYAKSMEEIFFLYHNSWGETKFERYKNVMEIPKILLSILNGSLVTRNDFQDALNLVCLSPYKSTKEFTSLRQTVKDLYEFFMNTRPDTVKRYITYLAGQYMIFYSKRKGNATVIECVYCETEEKVFYSISFNVGMRNEIKIDPSIPEMTYLQAVVKNMRNDAVQIYFIDRRKYGYFFVCDEQGSVNFYRKNISSLFDYLGRLYLFSQDAVNKVIASNPGSKLAKSKKPVEMYQLKKEDNNILKVQEFNPELSSKIADVKKKLVPFSIDVAADGKGSISYRYSVGNGGYSAFFPRENIGAMAGALKNDVLSLAGFQHFVTAISVSNIQNKIYRQFTSFLFTEKNRIEMLIERSMKAQ